MNPSLLLQVLLRSISYQQLIYDWILAHLLWTRDAVMQN